jgi:hypothetical protein
MHENSSAGTGAASVTQFFRAHRVGDGEVHFFSGESAALELERNRRYGFEFQATPGGAS